MSTLQTSVSSGVLFLGCADIEELSYLKSRQDEYRASKAPKATAQALTVEDRAYKAITAGPLPERYRVLFSYLLSLSGKVHNTAAVKATGLPVNVIGTMLGKLTSRLKREFAHSEYAHLISAVHLLIDITYENHSSSYELTALGRAVFQRYLDNHPAK